MEPSITIGLKDVVMMVGLFGTAFGIAASWVNLGRDVKELKRIVSNGLSEKVNHIEDALEKVEERMEYLPCHREVDVRYHRRDDPPGIDLEVLRRARCEGE